MEKKLKTTKIEKTVVEGYQKVEDAVVGTYQKICTAVLCRLSQHRDQ